MGLCQKQPPLCTSASETTSSSEHKMPVPLHVCCLRGPQRAIRALGVGQGFNLPSVRIRFCLHLSTRSGSLTSRKPPMFARPSFLAEKVAPSARANISCHAANRPHSVHAPVKRDTCRPLNGLWYAPPGARHRQQLLHETLGWPVIDDLAHRPRLCTEQHLGNALHAAVTVPLLSGLDEIGVLCKAAGIQNERHSVALANV